MGCIQSRNKSKTDEVQESQQVSEILGSSNTSESVILIFKRINRDLNDQRFEFVQYKKIKKLEEREESRKISLQQNTKKVKVKNYEFRHVKSDILYDQIHTEDQLNRSMDNRKKEQTITIAKLLNYKYDEIMDSCQSKKDIPTQNECFKQNDDHYQDVQDDYNNQSSDQCSEITDKLDELIYQCYHCNLEIQSEMIQLSCQHCYEIQCIRNIILNQLSNGQLIVFCKCGQKISQMLLKELLSEQEIDKLFSLQLEQLQQQI